MKNDTSNQKLEVITLSEAEHCNECTRLIIKGKDVIKISYEDKPDKPAEYYHVCCYKDRGKIE